MYYPYFRGKQYELITIRENSELLKESAFVPIIEPVKENLGGLSKALSAVVDAEGDVIVIVNPYHGDHSDNSDGILSLYQDNFSQHQNVSPGILLTDDVSVDDINGLCAEFENKDISLIHAGFTEAKLLSERLNNGIPIARHIFFEDNCGKLYRRHFTGPSRVLLRDGFQKRKNREHPEVEFFSDLHVTYEEEVMQGFGDFLIVGDDYSEGGGPAYTIAIHLTFIDADKDDEMHVHHFKSIRQDDPKDPAGKFAEALEKMVSEVERPGSNILRTDAVNEFLDLHHRGHFPGLGYVKKLSMKHHIETLAKYLSR